MSCKYISDGKLNLRVLRHDIVTLVEPLLTSIKFTNSEKNDKAISIQKEVLKKIEYIVEELKKQSDEITIDNS